MSYSEYGSTWRAETARYNNAEAARRAAETAEGRALVAARDARLRLARGQIDFNEALAAGHPVIIDLAPMLAPLDEAEMCDTRPNAKTFPTYGVKPVADIGACLQAIGDVLRRRPGHKDGLYFAYNGYAESDLVSLEDFWIGNHHESLRKVFQAACEDIRESRADLILGKPRLIQFSPTAADRRRKLTPKFLEVTGDWIFLESLTTTKPDSYGMYGQKINLGLLNAVVFAGDSAILNRNAFMRQDINLVIARPLILREEAEGVDWFRKEQFPDEPVCMRWQIRSQSQFRPAAGAEEIIRNYESRLQFPTKQIRAAERMRKADMPLGNDGLAHQLPLFKGRHL